MTIEELIDREKKQERKDRLNNLPLFLKRRKEYNKINGVRVGDYLLKDDGTYTRFTYISGNYIYTGGGEDSYYLGDGYLSYSGSLDSCIKISKLTLTKEIKPGKVWFFKDDYQMKDNAVYYDMNFRVYKLKKSKYDIWEFLNKNFKFWY